MLAFNVYIERVRMIIDKALVHLAIRRFRNIIFTEITY